MSYTDGCHAVLHVIWGLLSHRDWSDAVVSAIQLRLLSQRDLSDAVVSAYSSDYCHTEIGLMAVVSAI